MLQLSFWIELIHSNVRIQILEWLVNCQFSTSTSTLGFLSNSQLLRFKLDLNLNLNSGMFEMPTEGCDRIYIHEFNLGNLETFEHFECSFCVHWYWHLNPSRCHEVNWSIWSLNFYLNHAPSLGTGSQALKCWDIQSTSNVECSRGQWFQGFMSTIQSPGQWLGVFSVRKCRFKGTHELEKPTTLPGLS